MIDAKPTEWTLGYQDGLAGSPMRQSGIKGNGDSDNSASFYAYSEGYNYGVSQREAWLALTPEERAERERGGAFYGRDQWTPEDMERARPAAPVEYNRIKSDALDATLSERGSRYGVFANQALIAQHIKRAIRWGSSWEPAENDVQEALDMIANKIARIVNGDPEYADSWHDIAGYAKLVEDRINGRKQ